MDEARMESLKQIKTEAHELGPLVDVVMELAEQVTAMAPALSGDASEAQLRQHLEEHHAHTAGLCQDAECGTCMPQKREFARQARHPEAGVGPPGGSPPLLRNRGHEGRPRGPGPRRAARAVLTFGQEVRNGDPGKETDTASR